MGQKCPKSTHLALVSTTTLSHSLHKPKILVGLLGKNLVKNNFAIYPVINDKEITAKGLGNYFVRS